MSQNRVAGKDNSNSHNGPGDGRLSTAGKKRTRTGCLPCRKKRRKCDETKPICDGCKGRKDRCEWGVRLSFRPENAQHMEYNHPSMQHAPVHNRNLNFQIVDVTAEIVRDYFEESMPTFAEQDLPGGSRTITNNSPSTSAMSQNDLESTNIGDPRSTAKDPRSCSHHHCQSEDHGSTTSVTLNPITETTSVLERMLSKGDCFRFLSPQLSDSTFEDGIFLPGSQYQELHAQLRSRIIDTARSTGTSRQGTPDSDGDCVPTLQQQPYHQHQDVDEESRRLAHLSPEQEYVLWQNYIYEVASWLDKFDNNRHFEISLPVLAKTHAHLKYSILALSARQRERIERKLDYSCSLALYQHAIHLLLPLLQRRTTEVLASCVVLAVLEMLSCSPKAWRRHLDGCAALIQALGISGACGGLEQALFWCFARMDICGALISSETTLIPMQHKWMGGGDILDDLTMFRVPHLHFDMWANHIVYLCGRVVELLCLSGRWEQRHQRRSNIFDLVDYTTEWTQLFGFIEAWYINRPEQMKPLLTIPSDGKDPSKPFPTLLFGNAPGISGNQMYHTAALLMLKYKPADVRLTKKSHSMLWHARQICAISISNSHHGCWTNSTQPLWIAGQHMSHPSEHRAIIDIYERIERETGWATKWRVDDLKEFWGDLNG